MDPGRRRVSGFSLRENSSWPLFIIKYIEERRGDMQIIARAVGNRKIEGQIARGERGREGET